jgi:hypothetical protein
MRQHRLGQIDGGSVEFAGEMRKVVPAADPKLQDSMTARSEVPPKLTPTIRSFVNVLLW